VTADNVDSLSGPDHAHEVADLLLDDASVKMFGYPECDGLIARGLGRHLVECARPMRMKDQLSHICTLTEGCYNVLVPRPACLPARAGFHRVPMRRNVRE
jgi:hypothetical protein